MFMFTSKHNFQNEISRKLKPLDYNNFYLNYPTIKVNIISQEL